MIVIFSLIDITPTQIHRNNRYQNSSLSQKEWDFKRNQQRNWDTVVQLAGLRMQPVDMASPVLLKNQRPAAYGFGWEFGPLSDVNIWKCTYKYENEGSLDLWTLRGDFDNVPVITGLDETISYPYSCFKSSGDYINIVITKL